MATIRKPSIAIDTLRELISYDAATGELLWLPRSARHFQDGKHSAAHIAARWNSSYAGTPALACPEEYGYGHGDIFNERYKAHRVAWALHHGEWPDIDIDHENGDPADNRIKNLRLATKVQNSRNQKRSAANKSGVTGVCWNPRCEKWSAQIKFGGRKYHLGLFRDLNEAAKVRKAAERRHGFHPNHGRIAA